MKILQYLKEYVSKEYKDDNGKTTPIFVSDKTHELDSNDIKILKGYKDGIRFIANSNNKKIYFFNAALLHWLAAGVLGIPYGSNIKAEKGIVFGVTKSDFKFDPKQGTNLSFLASEAQSDLQSRKILKEGYLLKDWSFAKSIIGLTEYIEKLKKIPGIME